MAESTKDGTSTKCFSGILQRLLCGGSLPTHPSDQFIEPNRTKVDHSSKKLPFKTEENINITAKNPGIVAKLMGLDSLPEEENITTFCPYPRSRSVNSLDCLMQFNLTENFHHRRARTSVSFRELPSHDQDFKSEFLVFCFHDDEEKTQGFSIRKSKVGNQEIRKLKKATDTTTTTSSQSQTSRGQLKKVAESNRKDVHKSCNNRTSIDKTKKVDVTKSSLKKDVCRKQDRISKVKKQLKTEDYPKKMLIESKLEKKRKKSKSKYVVSTKIQPLFSSEEASPIHHHPQQVASTPAGNERKMKLNSRKSQARVTNPEHAITTKVEKQKEISQEADYYIKVLGEICGLTEEELNKSYWLDTRIGGNFKFEDFEDLCLHFGQEILELLIDQVVHELSY